MIRTPPWLVGAGPPPPRVVRGYPPYPGVVHETRDGADEGEPAVPGTDRTPLSAYTDRNLKVMDNRNEIREFLTSRRARITPDQRC